MKRKLRYIPEINELREAVAAVCRTIADEGKDLNALSLVDHPERFSENVDERFPEMLDYLRHVEEELRPIVTKHPLRALFVPNMAGMEVMGPQTFAQWWVMVTPVTRVEDLTEEEMLRMFMSSLWGVTGLDEPRGEGERPEPLEPAESFGGCRWGDEVAVDYGDLIRMVDRSALSPEAKLLALSRMTDPKKGFEELSSLLKAASDIARKHRPIVRELIDRAVETVTAEDFEKRIPNPLLGGFETDVRKGEDVEVRIQVVNYNGGGLRFTLDRRVPIEIVVGILLIPMMELSGYWELNAQMVIDRCKMLSDPTRFRILDALSERPYYAKELAELLDMSPSTLSHHMPLMIEAGLCLVTLSDRKLYYSLDPEGLESLGRYFLKRAEALRRKENQGFEE